MDGVRTRTNADDVLHVVTGVLSGVSAGEDPRQCLCRVVSGLVRAEACGYLRWEADSGRANVDAAYPAPAGSAVTAQASRGLAGAPSTLHGDPMRVGSSTWTVWVPLGSSGSNTGLLLVRRRGFSASAVRLLTDAQQPLAAVDGVLSTVERVPQQRRAARPVILLTPREHEVLQLLADGLLARTIAARLSLSPRTVNHHLGSIYDKLQVHDRLSAVLRARATGLLVDAPVLPQGRSERAERLHATRPAQ
ncbi:hypothetical protein CCE01nite_42010 [Cellulomonas cellasea]|uniref:HTH luxR-type domain-containing protein n=1 Tax=Cellulomonas cellasea TaxID=43670 RepID=A0A4Y3L1M2_9CELL|nr:hypothetical protein CCE01nite_42010 [Cellulomonas cellasea]